MIRLTAAVALLCLTLAGCAEDTACRHPEVLTRAEAGDAAPRVEERYLDDALVIFGAAYQYTCGERSSTQRLRSVLHVPSRTVTHTLAVRHLFQATGWRYYSGAMALEPEEVLEVSVDEREVGKCSRFSWMGCEQAEELLVALPAPLLAAAAERPRTIRIFNKDGREILFVLTPQQVRDHLALIASNTSPPAK